MGKPKLRGVAHFPQSHTRSTAELGFELCSAWIQNHCLPTGLCSLPGNHVPSPVPESLSVLSFSVFSPVFPLPLPRHLFSLSFSNLSLIFSLLFHFPPQSYFLLCYLGFNPPMVPLGDRSALLGSHCHCCLEFPMVVSSPC